MLRAGFASIVVAACSSAPPPPAAPPVAPLPPDAAAPQPDAGVPAAVTNAPAWMFRYTTADRKETWTLRWADDAALLVVETAQGTQRYLGSAADTAATLKVDATTGSARMTLDCKHVKRPVGPRCNDTKVAPIDVLDCYHPDFKAPMPFAHAPGIEYVVDDHCNGYRLVAP